MSTWLVVGIAAIVVVAIAFIIGRASASRRTRHLRERFGTEYDRTAKVVGGKRDAEAELAAREERHEQLNIRPLPTEARKRYADQWRTVQSQFVDAPAAALSAADGLVNSVMSDRGYPMDDFEQRAADISVEHPQVVENYRAAHRVSEQTANGGATTEDQRLAMQRYRSLFEELLDSATGERANRRVRTADTSTERISA
jgi:hypothetical protein